MAGTATPWNRGDAGGAHEPLAPPRRGVVLVTLHRRHGGVVQRPTGGSLSPFAAAAPRDPRGIPGATGALPAYCGALPSLRALGRGDDSRSAQVLARLRHCPDTARIPGDVSCAGTNAEDQRTVMQQGGAARLSWLLPTHHPARLLHAGAVHQVI